MIFDPVTHTYHDDNGRRLHSVTWILNQAGLCDFSFVQEEVRERAMKRGRSVHWMLQLEDQGLLNYRTVPKNLRPYRKAYLDWKRASGFVPELIEQEVESPLGYAGRLDRTGTLPPTPIFPIGSKAIVDFKTGAVQEWSKWQLVAYAMALPHARNYRRIGLSLFGDGTYRVKEFLAWSWNIDFAKFIDALRRIHDSERDYNSAVESIRRATDQVGSTDNR